MDTPPPPLPSATPPPPPVTPPQIPSSAPPPVVPPSVPPPAPSPASGPAFTDKFVAALKQVNWKQLGMDFKTFGLRFITGDFALIKPEPHEQPAVAAHPPRMAALIVWRRALLFMACVFSVVLLIKSCFDPHTWRTMTMEQTMEGLEKSNPALTAEQRKTQANTEVDSMVEGFGATNIKVVDALFIGSWITQIASAGFLILAAMRWRDWRKSRLLALLGVAVMLVPLLLAMVFPWASLMDFSHIEKQLAGAEGATPEMIKQQMLITRLGFQGGMAVVLLASALPFFYGLFNGVLRATLAAKTLIPASIVCGWSSLLLAITICVPWFAVLSVADQFQADALVIIGILCLLAAPLSLVLKSRRLGAPLTPEEASPVVKRARLIFTGLNLAGVLLLVAYASEKDWISASEVITGVLQYLFNLMLVTVVAVDWLVFLLDRAHRKLTGDAQPEESLRQLGEVLPRA